MEERRCCLKRKIAPILGETCKVDEQTALMEPECLDGHIPLEILLDVITDDALELFVQVWIGPASKRDAAMLKNVEQVGTLGHTILDEGLRTDRHVPVSSRLELGHDLRHQKLPRCFLKRLVADGLEATGGRFSARSYCSTNLSTPTWI